MLKWKKLFVSLLSVSVIAGLGVAPVKAAQTVTPYTYKVTLSAGNKGTINGQQKVEEVDLAAGSTVSFDINDIKVSDEKYYVKGIRLSGRDNSEALAAPAFRVNGDADYVVAYGIKGDMVAYTVNYEDEQGNKLAESQTFYGNVGDKPVVAYRYIENYVPQALSLTKTLSDNEAENVFTFKYAPGATNRVVETVNHVTVVIPGNTITNTVTIPAGTHWYHRWKRNRSQWNKRYGCEWNHRSKRHRNKRNRNKCRRYDNSGWNRCQRRTGCRPEWYSRESG